MSRHYAEGVFRINLETGKVNKSFEDKASAVKLPKELEGVVSRQYCTSRQYSIEMDFSTSPLVVGDTVSALSVEKQGDGKQKMSLKRWDRKTCQPLQTVEMLSGKDLWSMVPLDGAHVLVKQEDAFQVFSLQTGKRITGLPLQPAPTAVVGGQVFQLVETNSGYWGSGPSGPLHEWARTLQARNLETGKLVWERPAEPRRMLEYPP
jgi:hypothetical protein